jgi:hypothetical protein
MAAYVIFGGKDDDGGDDGGNDGGEVTNPEATAA